MPVGGGLAVCEAISAMCADQLSLILKLYAKVFVALTWERL